MKKTLLLAAIVALGFALLMYKVFSIDTLFSLMTLSFLLGIPFGVGMVTIYFSSIEWVQKSGYRFFAPWVPVIMFMGFTLCFSMEGWACWLMILPFFLLASSLGGIVAGRIRLKKYNKGKTYISVLLLIPLLTGPIEKGIHVIPGRYEAYTYIDIHTTDKNKIWNNVTRVRTISQEQDKGWLTRTLGFPRPIRAELNYNGVGAYRKAIFDKGLIFHERVLYYEDGRRMDFSIKAHPYEIPSTTMDKHVVIGGDFFDVLNGTYVLQPLGGNNYRLHLYSHFKLTTTFNFYASWWAGWIMSDIQNNILQIIKLRAESNGLY